MGLTRAGGRPRPRTRGHLKQTAAEQTKSIAVITAVIEKSCGVWGALSGDLNYWEIALK